MVGHNGPLLELEPNHIFAALNDDLIVLDVYDFALDAADGRDLIALVQGCAKLFGVLLLFAFGAENHEVEHGDKGNQHKDHRVAAAAGWVRG